MMFKKIVFNILLVTLVVFILDFALGRTLRYFYFNETSGLHYRTTYSMETTEADLLIFGSSRANHHYVPEVFEDSLDVKYYNTGRDGNGVFYQLAVLKSILKRYIPKVIIIDYYGSFQYDDRAYERLSSLLPYYKSHEEIRNIIELKSPYERLKLLSEIYPFNSNILTIGVGNLEFNRLRKPDNKGYVALNKEWQYEADTIATLDKYDIDPNKINAFKEFVTLAKNSGVRVYVIYSPIFVKFNYLQDIEVCQDLCSSEKIPFWNYSKDTAFLQNKRLFQDVVHLNNNGALAFSKLIVKRIKQDEK